ncbi:hypothetical protein [Ensifer sp. ENS04]|nr:hypothetical protein [Ensifer sp. ENS04]
MQDRLFIDGKWEKPRRGGTLDVIDPATEEIIDADEPWGWYIKG